MTSLEQVRRRAESDAKTHGYYLNPDPDFLHNLLTGLKENEERYGYPSCPCRLATGHLELDRDIICPCYYRDPDVEEFGFCYCALYVRNDVAEGKLEINPIPERRPLSKQEKAYFEEPKVKTAKTTDTTPASEIKASDSSSKLWFCQQCGYVCFRDEPPHICPICKAKKEMFSEIFIGVNFRVP
ncbi:MAG: ferredoxin-thioredoxin reductase catalytic domain-containing protein [Promethearchaeota archaeon]